MTLINPPTQHDLLRESKRFQYAPTHQIDRYGEIVGQWRINDGVIDNPANLPIETLNINAQIVTIGSSPKPLKVAPYFCNAVQIQSVRSDMSDNGNRIGVGNSSGWGNTIDPGGSLNISSPVNGTIDLSKIYIYGTPGDQVSLLIME